jgi:hypothetical protein
MNIFTAPAEYLLERVSQKERRGRPRLPEGHLGLQPGPEPGQVKGYFLMVTTLLAIAMVGVGLYLALAGGSGDTQVSGAGITIKTREAGLGLVALGAIFWLAAGAMIMKGE